MAKPKFKIKHTITKKEWNKTHKDFKSIIDGIHYVMKLTDKGTALVPVKIIDEVSESLGAELDLIKQSSKDVRDFIKKVFSNSDFRDMKSDKDFLKYLKSMYEGIDESVNESKEEVTPQQLSKIQSDIRKINSKIKVYISKHPITKGELSIELGAGHNDDSEIQKIYKVLKKHTGDWRTGTMFNESVNEAYIVTYAKKKGEKPAAAAFQLRGSALSFERDLKKDGYITMVTQKKVKGIDESVNEGKDPEIITQLRDVLKNGYKTLKDPKSGKRMKVDTYSASAIVGVYDKLNPSNKEKFVKQGLLGMQSLAFKFIK
jgi:hypothetical protein